MTIETYDESKNNLKEEIVMYEWEKIGPTEQDFKTMSNAEIEEEYEYILYDRENRELVYKSGQGRTLYYRIYEEPDEYTLNVYTLSFNGMLTEPYHEEIIKTITDGTVYIVDQVTMRDEAIEYDEYKQLEEKYIKYIDENKDHRKKEIDYIDDSLKSKTFEERIEEFAIENIINQEKEPDDVRFSEAQIIEKDKENKYLVLVHYTCYMAFWNGKYVDEEKDFYNLVIVQVDNSEQLFIDEYYGYQGITENFKKLDNDINMVSVLSEEIKVKNNWKY